MKKPKPPRRPHVNYNWNLEVDLNLAWITGAIFLLLLVKGEPDVLDAIIEFLLNR